MCDDRKYMGDYLLVVVFSPGERSKSIYVDDEETATRLMDTLKKSYSVDTAWLPTINLWRWDTSVGFYRLFSPAKEVIKDWFKNASVEVYPGTCDTWWWRYSTRPKLKGEALPAWITQEYGPRTDRDNALYYAIDTMRRHKTDHIDEQVRVEGQPSTFLSSKVPITILRSSDQKITRN